MSEFFFVTHFITLPHFSGRSDQADILDGADVEWIMKAVGSLSRGAADSCECHSAHITPRVPPMRSLSESNGSGGPVAGHAECLKPARSFSDVIPPDFHDKKQPSPKPSRKLTA